MSDNLARARAREAADLWLAEQGITRHSGRRFDGLDMDAAFLAGWKQGDAVVRPAWEEMHDNLAWVQKAGRAMHAIMPRSLGLNLARVASDLVAAAYPSLREFIGRDGAGVAAPQDEWVIEQAEGQRQIDAAVCLIKRAARMAEELASVYASGTGESRDGRRDAIALMTDAEEWLKAQGWGGSAPGEMTATQVAAQEAFVSRALDEGIGEVTEADEVSLGDFVRLAFTPAREAAIAQAADQAGRIISRPVTNLRDVPDDIAGPLSILTGGFIRAVSVAVASDDQHAPVAPPVFDLTTGDPVFDPTKPVKVNGFLYHPSKEQSA